MPSHRFQRYSIIAIGCFLLSWLTYSFEGIISDGRQLALNDIQERLESAVREQSAYIETAANNFSEGSYKVPDDQKNGYPTFIFVNGQLKSWSSNDLIPTYNQLSGDYATMLIETEDGAFVSTKKSLNSRNIKAELFSIIELQRTYQVQNKYIQSGMNEDIIPKGIMLAKAPDGVPVMLDGNELFRIEFPENYRYLSIELVYISFGLFALGLIFLIYSTYQFGGYLRYRFGFVSGVLAILLVFSLTKAALLFFDLPGSVWTISIFEARFYYSSIFNSSIGALAINLLLCAFLCWFVLIHFPNTRVESLLKGASKFTRWIVALAMFSISLLIISGHFLLVENISLHSQIALDISQSISFDANRVTAYFTLLLFGVIYFIIHQQASRILKSSDLSFGYYVSIALPAYLLYYLLSDNNPLWWVTICGHAVFITVTIATGWVFALSKIRYNTFLYFFSSALISALLMASFLYKAEENKTLVAKQKFANQLLIENDVLGEYLLSEMITDIQDDVQIKSRFLNPRLLTTQVSYQLRQQHLNEYFDKYDVNVLYFDAEGSSMNPGEVADFENYLQPEFLEDHRTEYEGIFFVNDLSLNGLFRYYVVVPMTRYETFLGHIVLELRLKKFIPSSLYPELLVDQKFVFTPQPDFNYALYRDRKLIFEAGNYNYISEFDPSLFDNSEIFTNGKEDGDMHHLAVRGGDGRVYVISSLKYADKDILANFSFLFMCLVLLIAVLTAADAIKVRYQEVEFNFATRLQIYLSLAFFLPLLVTSIVVLNTINESYREELDITYREKADNISQHLTNELERYFFGSVNRIQLSQLVSEISRYAQNDINLFDAEGRLIVSSQQRIFDTNLKSRYINPQALYQIVAGEKESLTFDERIGDLNYRSTYHALRSDTTGRLLGTLSIPFFESTNNLKNEQLDVFTSLLNIFTFIFLISLIFVNLATSFLTRPLNLIAQKLSKTRLEDKNQPIDWKSNDEIGVLVEEYNRMLVNLEKSKESLAQNEKEMAWREMAKQVAHEIKNPLTPMKLTLQQLQRTLADQNEQTASKADKPIKTVLHQIDTLSDIATSFSAFAKMPLPVNQKTDLTAVVKNAVQLFHEKCEIKSELPQVQLCVYADEKLLGRILNNIILNGIQSVADEKSPEISITLTHESERAVIEISDNGQGIADRNVDKIFVPNFSTKTSGSGLGLAIAKRGIEHAGGSISFITKQGSGTTFTIELPLFSE